MKNLVTHLRPHLDDVCALWLLRRYLPEAKDAEIGFVATNERGGDVHDSADTVHIGVGRGMFDEHKGDVGECATTLVFKHIASRVEIPPQERRALQKIADWVLLQDTGKLNAAPQHEFSVPVILEGEYDRTRDNGAVVDFGFAILDALLIGQRNVVKIEDDWQKRVEFVSRFGKAVAIESKTRGMDAHAYALGIPLVVIADDTGYRTIRADALSDIDLTPVYETIKTLDPRGRWYFHHSKKMLICGGEHAPGSPPSALPLRRLIEILS